MPTRSYLDHAAGSPMPQQVVSALTEHLGRAGNPSALHASGRAARRVLEESREAVAAAVGAAPDEVVFTSGGTEANNMALRGARRPAREAMVISAIEHPSIADIRGQRARVEVLPVESDGRVPAEAWARLSDEAAVVSVMWANNETGVVQDIEALVSAAHRVGAWAHSDAVQAVGHLPVDFRDSGLDLLTMTAHKLGGPVGVGALVRRRGVPLAPSGFGGGQEAKLRSGTVPVALVAGFAAALRWAVQRRAAEAERLGGLRQRLVRGLIAVEGVVDNSAAVTSPAILNVTVGGARADDLLLLLDAAGIDASTGSACTAGLHQPSEVLLAMGRSLADAGSSLRFSLGWSTSETDIDRLLSAFPGAVERARDAARA